MRILVDAMGGDLAPKAAALGAIRAAQELGMEVVLVGRGEAILQCLKENGVETLPKGVEIANAEDVVDMHDDPATVIRARKDSSMVVGLLNIGTEDSKGTELQKQTYSLLENAKTQGLLNFIGNVEARDVLLGDVDVVVADGFSGNILLKSIEGTAKFLSGEIKGMLLASWKTKLAALLMKDGLKRFKAMLDPSEVGGTAFLGISKPVIKAHGASNEEAIENAIAQARDVAASGLIDQIAAHVGEMSVNG